MSPISNGRDILETRLLKKTKSPMSVSHGALSVLSDEFLLRELYPHTNVLVSGVSAALLVLVRDPRQA